MDLDSNNGLQVRNIMMSIQLIALTEQLTVITFTQESPHMCGFRTGCVRVGLRYH